MILESGKSNKDMKNLKKNGLIYVRSINVFAMVRSLLLSFWVSNGRLEL